MVSFFVIVILCIFLLDSIVGFRNYYIPSNSAGVITYLKSQHEDSMEHWETKLNVIIARQRLEDQHMSNVIKRRPRFYSYHQCKEWVRSEYLWDSKQEWETWIDMGEKRNPLVPSDPEARYTADGTWLSWYDFLGIFP
mmetsp:Transcript_21023/g.23386  ORF Transcript_21023/g.23386 Transcript_21023/m.23386 type:complete len:138 (-) Transcript_21023:266-679(-)|eukprot:CAMPEP_0194173318 /NCGR_PEP_ID=MMETSP0154-20130528/7670_1 /TAXON_ID=1049557 /ORGANISM="Thalassiothrix antarctica, Strain L6-D1" /LENGTH=137 /DNA_ID=CAMNT_0038886333 /DNA_START=46 /DNA_END=459 /DNA_ORIENTATION=-